MSNLEIVVGELDLVLGEGRFHQVPDLQQSNGRVWEAEEV